MSETQDDVFAGPPEIPARKDPMPWRMPDGSLSHGALFAELKRQKSGWKASRR